MRIKWSAIPKVVNPSPVAAAPWGAAAATERKKEPTKQSEPNKKNRKKSEGPLDWLRRSR